MSDSVINKIAAYPFPVAIIQDALPPMKGLIWKVASHGFLMKCETIHYYKVGEHYQIEFQIPTFGNWIRCSAKVMKTYDTQELTVIREKEKLLTVEFHFEKLSDVQRQVIEIFLKKNRSGRPAMRIIAGKYKGHQLVDFDAEHIRPTTDRVKESLFNIIQQEIDGARCLDLFSGTGNLGLEALSRGAREVVFVEKSKKSIMILEKNLKKLKITEDYSILNKDVLKFLRDYEGEPFDLIFADPPFTEKMAHDVIEAADVSKAFHPQTLMMIESQRREKVLDHYTTLERYDLREFGDKFLSFFSKKET